MAVLTSDPAAQVAQPFGAPPPVAQLAGLSSPTPTPSGTDAGGVDTPGAPPLPAPISGALVQNPHPGGVTSLSANMQLGLNPQLPQHPSTIPTDSQFEAQDAMARNDLMHQYNDVLKQLGYMDPSSGQFVMGTVESGANRQRDELARSQALAVEDVTNQMQSQGTLFSGLRGTQQARAEHPFVQALADLDVSTPQQLSDLFTQAGNLISGYNLTLNQELADYANRAAQAAINNPHLPAPTPAPPAPPAPPTPPGSTPGPSAQPVPGGPFVSTPETSNVTYVGNKQAGGAGAWTPNVPGAGGQVTDVYPNTGLTQAQQAGYGSAYQAIYIDANGNTFNSPGPGRTQVY